MSNRADQISDVLAERYATPEMCAIWSPRGKIIAERHLWLALLRAQIKNGLEVPDGVLEAYAAAIQDVDSESIARRERKLRHDVKARIEEFCAISGGHEYIHRGMTSRDLTDNVEQMQIRQSLQLVRDRVVALLVLFAEKAAEYRDQPVAGRSHNQIGQITTVGKRLANSGEELLYFFGALEGLIARYPLRGMKGAMGTGQDMLDLLEGDSDAYMRIEDKTMTHLGFGSIFENVGQVYPRSLDFEVASMLASLASGPTNFANLIRLMSGFNLASEGFKDGQVGSTAMPHKMNTRTCERICGFNKIIHGYASMLGQLAGDQWQEGDVSCSVVRRVGIADVFLAMDGLIESTLTVLLEMRVHQYVIEQELQQYAPYLSTTAILMAAVKKGAPREFAHEAIKEHAVDVAIRLREGGSGETDLLQLLADSQIIPLDYAELKEVVTKVCQSAGDAGSQVDAFVREVKHSTAGYHRSVQYYRPASIL